MLQDKFDDALLNFQKVLVREPQNALARINVGYICLKKGIFGEAIEHLSRAIRLDNDKKATLYAHFYLGLVYLERDMFEDAQTFFQKDDRARTEPDRSVLRARAGVLVQRAARRGGRHVESGSRGEHVQPMGKTLRRGTDDRGGGRSALSEVARRALACSRLRCRSGGRARAARRAGAPRPRPVHGGVLSVGARTRDVAARQRVGERHVPRACRVRASACCWRLRPIGVGFASGSVRARPSGAPRSPFPSRSES